MNISKTFLLTFVSAALVYGAPAREIVELQRDVAALQEQIRVLQRSMDQRLESLTSLVEQSLTASNKVNTSVAALENGLRDRLTQQLSTPVAGLNLKLDQMTTEFQNVRESIADMNERLSKLQTQMTDLGNTVKVMQAPPPPPPGSDGSSSAAGVAGPPAGLSAKDLYEQAQRDKSSGALDLSMQGFEEYLKWYGNTELAPNAQFAIGEILYGKNDYEGAIRAFDTVLERYPENNKTADAMYMKGMSLLRAGKRNQAAQEFLNVIQKYPRAEVTPKATTQRKALGLGVPKPATSSRSRR
jgi:tol-pal system protein YbgF